jgi:hypothetical protein
MRVWVKATMFAIAAAAVGPDLHMATGVGLLGAVAEQGHGKGGPAWTPPRTAWKEPDLHGTYTNSAEMNTPLERPDEFAGRSIGDFSPDELAAIEKDRRAKGQIRLFTAGGTETGAGPTHWYESLGSGGTRPWLIVDPADGKIPPLTPQAERHEAMIAALNADRRGEGRADSWLDRSLWDRCITRGIPGSMMPGAYGNTYEIVQTPEHIVIRYEMVHEARIIPLDNRPHLGPSIRQYLGDARGHWEGNTLVVETTNFTNRAHFGYNNRYTSDRLRLVERFTPVSADTLQWEVTFDDPGTWTRPWTFTMPLTRDDGHPVFEYACHEGNLGLEHILIAARAEEAAARNRR